MKKIGVKKAMGILVLLMVTAMLLTGAKEAVALPRDGTVSVLGTFSLERNGEKIPNGGIIDLQPNVPVSLDVIPGYLRPIQVATSGDHTYSYVSVTVGVIEGNQTIGGGTVTLDYGTITRTLQINTQNVVDGVLKIQLKSTVVDADGPRGEWNTEVFSLRVRVLPTMNMNYFFIPHGMNVRDGNGNEVTSLRMTAGSTRELYVEVDDYGNDDDPSNDYRVFAVNESKLERVIEKKSGIEVASALPNLLGLTPVPTMTVPPRTITMLKVSASNPGGTQSSNYDPVFTEFVYRLTFTGKLGNGATLNGISVETPHVSVTVTADDDAGGGGTCDVLGLGVAVLAIPPLFIRKRS
ncbi:MAG: hypothetical protein LBJ36_08760 [Synergistaceae bacterium]|nr:hypothetical protein [Synergistaceae bacterium]